MREQMKLMRGAMDDQAARKPPGQPGSKCLLAEQPARQVASQPARSAAKTSNLNMHLPMVRHCDFDRC